MECSSMIEALTKVLIVCKELHFNLLPKPAMIKYSWDGLKTTPEPTERLS